MKHLKKFKEIVKGKPLDEEEERQFANNTHMDFISRNSPAGQSGKITTVPGSKPTTMSSSDYNRKVNPALKTLNKKAPNLKQSGKQI